MSKKKKGKSEKEVVRLRREVEALRAQLAESKKGEPQIKTSTKIFPETQTISQKVLKKAGKEKKLAQTPLEISDVSFLVKDFKKVGILSLMAIGIIVVLKIIQPF